MYFSFNNLPKVKDMARKEKMVFYKKIMSQLNLTKLYTYLILLSFFLGITFIGVCASYGLKGDTFLYLSLFIIVVTLFLGDLYIINKVISPEVKKHFETEGEKK